MKMTKGFVLMAAATAVMTFGVAAPAEARDRDRGRGGRGWDRGDRYHGRSYHGYRGYRGYYPRSSYSFSYGYPAYYGGYYGYPAYGYSYGPSFSFSYYR